jgi:ketosteroid isomerase-like protein
MPLAPRRSTLCLLLTVATASAMARADNAPASCPPTGVTADAEKAAILKVITDMQDAWNGGDFRGYMQGFKNPDVIFVSGGRFQNGWQGTLDHYVRDYGASPEARGTLKFYDITVEMLAPDAAQLISHYQLVRQQHPQYGINTRLMRKVNGHWVIALNHVSSSETAPEETLKGRN